MFNAAAMRGLLVMAAKVISDACISMIAAVTSGHYYISVSRSKAYSLRLWQSSSSDVCVASDGNKGISSKKLNQTPAFL